MPDWEFRLWDMQSVCNINNTFLKESLEAKKWAFAADYIRLYATYTYGGVYLDTDVLVYCSFERLLNDRSFIGRENSIHIEGRSTRVYLSSHCFGCEKGNEYVRQCLSYYSNRHFRISDNESLPNALKYSMTLLPFVQCEIAKQYGYDDSVLANNTQILTPIGLKIYPSSFFDAVGHNAQSFCSHLALGSWRDTSRFEENYALSYKIGWRVRRVIETILGKFGYIMVKLK